MTFSEFKAWLDGFSDAMGDAPTPEQWAKIKAKMSQVREPQSFAPNTIPYPPRPRVPSFYEIDKTPLGPHWGLPTVTCGPNGSGGITFKDGVAINVQGAAQ